MDVLVDVLVDVLAGVLTDVDKMCIDKSCEK